jgi:hypothetical protein
MDPTTGELIRLFNPRTDIWNQHFRIQAGRIRGTIAPSLSDLWLDE